MGYAKSFHDDVEINMTSDSYKQSKESPNPSDNENQVIHKIIRIRLGIGRSYIIFIMVFESFGNIFWIIDYIYLGQHNNC